MSPVVVRPARPEEYDAIGRLTVQAYEGNGGLDASHWYRAVLADVATRAEHGEVLAAVDAGTVLGAVTFVLPGSRFAELSRPGEAEFRMLAVAPWAQRRGIGEALVRACLDRAADLGRTAVVICTRDFSAGALRLYQRLGFVRRPELDWAPEPGVDLLALRHDLSPARQRAASPIPSTR
jgi:ribosomal protein S18 acetylase RimI-like enzyme